MPGFEPVAPLYHARDNKKEVFFEGGHLCYMGKWGGRGTKCRPPPFPLKNMVLKKISRKYAQYGIPLFGTFTGASLASPFRVHRWFTSADPIFVSGGLGMPMMSGGGFVLFAHSPILLVVCIPRVGSSGVWLF